MGGWVNHHKLFCVSGVGYDEGFGLEYQDLKWASIQDRGCCNHRGMRDGWLGEPPQVLCVRWGYDDCFSLESGSDMGLYYIQDRRCYNNRGKGGWVINHHKLFCVSGVGYDDCFSLEYQDLTWANIQDHGCCNHRGMQVVG